MYICSRCESLQSQKQDTCDWCGHPVRTVSNTRGGIIIHNIKTTWNIKIFSDMMSEETKQIILNHRAIFYNSRVSCWSSAYYNANHIHGQRYVEIDFTKDSMYTRNAHCEILKKTIRELDETEANLVILNSTLIHTSEDLCTCLINDRSVVRLRMADMLYIWRYLDDNSLNINTTGSYYKEYSRSWILETNILDQLKAPYLEAIHKFNSIMEASRVTN